MNKCDDKRLCSTTTQINCTSIDIRNTTSTAKVQVSAIENRSPRDLVARDKKKKPEEPKKDNLRRESPGAPRVDLRIVSDCNSSFSTLSSTILTDVVMKPNSNSNSNSNSNASSGDDNAESKGLQSVDEHAVYPSQCLSPNKSDVLPIVFTPKSNNVSTQYHNSNRNNLNIDVNMVESPKTNLDPVRRTPLLAVQSPRPASQSQFHSASTQLVSEEIDQGAGIIFQNLDELPEENFLHAPGVHHMEKAVPKKNRKRRRREMGSGPTEEPEKVRSYVSRTSFAGVSIFLGSDHKSSVSAAAALDIANKLWWGSENVKPLYVLSESEVMKALDAIGYGVRVHQDEFMHNMFTQKQKKYFEELVDRALSSLGGRDDFYADVLCGINPDGDKKKKLKPGRPKKIKADAAEKKSGTQSPEPGSSGQEYNEGYDIFDVDDDGMFSWRTIY